MSAPSFDFQFVHHQPRRNGGRDRTVQFCIEPRFVEALQLSTHWCYLRAALPERHLACRLMGQTESKTCIGKGLKYPRHIRLLPIQAPKRRNVTFGGHNQIGSLGSWRYLGAAASNAATCIRDESAPAASSAEIRRDGKL
jgi:hypothetical protein